ncbi:unnamed protein product [Enterobius vermicularis]|uniref:Uncharacterized protein n=1 Tax=Enterobius vermicularis TaxID=51028 RepID=A0A0N4UWN8_ENTVE|nr:unnamed protein product [Enterobius vermicularis]
MSRFTPTVLSLEINKLRKYELDVIRQSSQMKIWSPFINRHGNVSLKKKFGEALDEGNTEGAELIKTFKDQIYVDGSIVGYDDGKEVVRLYHEFKQIFADASFNTPALRSNMKRSYEPIPAKDSEIGSIQKVLGIKWQRQTDQSAGSREIESKNFGPINVDLPDNALEKRIKIQKALKDVSKLPVLRRVRNQQPETKYELRAF